MSASVADDMIRSYFDRWQRLEEEKRTISDDLKELFAEARGNGLDTKALRAVFREQVGDKAAAQEFDAICDLYRASLNAPRAGRARESQSYAEAKGRQLSGNSGQLTDTQEQPEEPATQSVQPVVSAVCCAPLESASDEISSVISPSPANAPRLAADDEAAQANPIVVGALSNPQPNLLPGAGKAPEADSSPASGAALSEKKDCLKLKDGHCKISFDTPALCSVCNAERMKARAA